MFYLIDSTLTIRFKKKSLKVKIMKKKSFSQINNNFTKNNHGLK